MSDFAGSVHPATTSAPGAVAGAPGTAGTPGADGSAGSAGTVHESYSFACMRCGHGWEQAYEIERHADPDGHPYVVYLAGGERVPSPLSSPSCLNCGGSVVRIMRAGRVTSAASQAHTYGHGTAPAKPSRARPAPPVRARRRRARNRRRRTTGTFSPTCSTSSTGSSRRRVTRRHEGLAAGARTPVRPRLRRVRRAFVGSFP